VSDYAVFERVIYKDGRPIEAIIITAHIPLDNPPKCKFTVVYNIRSDHDRSKQAKVPHVPGRRDRGPARS
jgi:hypothetical protein